MPPCLQGTGIHEAFDVEHKVSGTCDMRQIQLPELVQQRFVVCISDKALQEHWQKAGSCGGS